MACPVGPLEHPPAETGHSSSTYIRNYRPASRNFPFRTSCREFHSRRARIVGGYRERGLRSVQPWRSKSAETWLRIRTYGVPLHPCASCHASLPRFPAWQFQAGGIRELIPLLPRLSVAASDRRTASELFSLARHFRPRAIGRLEATSLKYYTDLVPKIYLTTAATDAVSGVAASSDGFGSRVGTQMIRAAITRVRAPPTNVPRRSFTTSENWQRRKALKSAVNTATGESRAARHAARRWTL